jgi:hypothetical protein
MMNTTKTMRLSLQGGLLALTGLAVAPHAWADTVTPPFGQSTMVSNTESTSDNFSVSQAGTVTVSLSGLDWGSTLSSLSFTASSATQVLASWYGTGVTSDTATFNVEPGSYFTNIMATAVPGGLDLGLYSLKMTFTPAVPLPSSGWLLLTGMFVLVGLARAVRPLELMGTAEA